MDEKLVQIRDTVRRSGEAATEMEQFCDAAHDDYRAAKDRAGGVGSTTDELTEMVTARLAKIQEAIISARLVVLDTSVEKAKRDMPSSYSRLFATGGAGTGAAEESQQ